ncbi:hypothetical protein FIBSPDRAFT_878227, partial [Athelia psychrophila]
IAAHPRNVERCRPRSPTRVHTSQDGTQCRPRGRHRRSHDFKPPPQRLRACQPTACVSPIHPRQLAHGRHAATRYRATLAPSHAGTLARTKPPMPIHTELRPPHLPCLARRIPIRAGALVLSHGLQRREPAVDQRRRLLPVCVLAHSTAASGSRTPLSSSPPRSRSTGRPPRTRTSPARTSPCISAIPLARWAQRPTARRRKPGIP